MDSAGAGAILFTGRSAPYYPYVYTNSHYAFGDRYQPGSVICDGILYENILMNLDAHFDCLCVRSSVSAPIVCLEKDKVTEFSYGGHDFINLCGRFREVDGFVEILACSGEMMLVRKNVKRPVEDISGTVVKRSFQDDVSFWVINGTSMMQMTSRKSFIACWPGKKKELNAVWRSLDYIQQGDNLYSFPILFKVVSAE